MDIIVVVYKQQDRIDFLGKVFKHSKKGRQIGKLVPLGSKIYKSAIQRRKEEIQLDSGDYEVLFKEVE